MPSAAGMHHGTLSQPTDARSLYVMKLKLRMLLRESFICKNVFCAVVQCLYGFQEDHDIRRLSNAT